MVCRSASSSVLLFIVALAVVGRLEAIEALVVKIADGFAAIGFQAGNCRAVEHQVFKVVFAPENV